MVEFFKKCMFLIFFYIRTTAVNKIKMRQKAELKKLNFSKMLVKTAAC